MVIPIPRMYLKDINSKVPTLIYMQAKYSINEQPQRVVLTSTDKVLPNNWDFIKQRCVVSRKNLEAGEINLYLDKMETTFKTVFRGFMLEGKTPTQNAVKEKMEELLNLKPKVVVPQVTFYSFIDSFLNDCKVSKTVSTIRAYNSTIKGLKEFGKLSNKEIAFEDITMAWYTSFIQFLQQKNLCNGSIGKYIKNLKAILNAASEQGLNTNYIFRNKSFAKPNEISHKTFLTIEEINLIAKMDFSENKQKEISRDYFIISNLSGLRFSDVTRIKKEHIINDRIQMITLKTGQEVIIPIATLVKNIFEKYNYELPRCPVNQVHNRYIKEIGKDAGLTNYETVTKTIGGKKVSISYQKWEILSSHSARRSFVTNAILAGISSSSIMLMTGHRSHSVLSSYVKFDSHQNALKLSSHPFFN